MNWALKFYDADRDILLSPSEAQSGGRRVPVDGGREWRRARHHRGISAPRGQFILARY